MSELCIINGSKTAVVVFGGMMLHMGAIPPFEFSRYLSSLYENKIDLMFYVDRKQCWYNCGIEGITRSVEETVAYLDTKTRAYDKIVFMGCSSGGYAAILFGSLCNNVSHVIAFIPQTTITEGMHANRPAARGKVSDKYADLINVVNGTTHYTLYGDTSVLDRDGDHHIWHCERLAFLPNATVVRLNHVSLPTLRDNGEIKRALDRALQT
jgi:hypothetical protein